MVAKKSASLKKAADRLVSVSKDMRVRARLASQELFEMDRRVEMRLAVEKGVKKGRAEGRKKGLEEGREKGREEGLVEGRTVGRMAGRKEGVAAGRNEERRRIVTLIERGASLDDIKKSLSEKKVPGRKRS